MATTEPKRVLCIGATGRSGLMFVESALSDGHLVTAVVRSEPSNGPNTLSSNQTIVGTGASSEVLSGQPAEPQAPPHAEVIQHTNLTVVVADLKSEKELAALLPGHDVVVVTLGGWPEKGKPFTLHQDVARAYAPAMQASGVSRLFVCFGMGLLFPPPEEGATGVFDILRIDMFAALDLMQRHELEYTIWCPGDFPHGPRSEAYVEAIGEPPSKRSVTTGMVADAMCKELRENKYSKQRVGIASA